MIKIAVVPEAVSCLWEKASFLLLTKEIENPQLLRYLGIKKINHPRRNVKPVQAA